MHGVDDDETLTALRPGATNRRRVLLASACVALAATVLGYRDEITEVLEPDPEPYSPTQHAKPMIAWMTEGLPTYVIAVSSENEKDRQRETAQFMEASRFHDGLARRVRRLVESVDEWYAKSSRPMTFRSPEDVQGGVEGIDRNVSAIESMLRAIDAPFSLSQEISGVKIDTRWRLRMIVTTTEVLRTTEFQDDERGVAYFTLRVRRLDDLNIIDRVHGETRNGRAIILEGNARALIYSRYLPVLSSTAELRNLFERERASPTEESVLRAALRALLPEPLRPHAETIGALASERRDALESLEDALGRYGRKVREPEDFFFKARWLRELEAGLGRERHPDLLEQLERFSESGQVSKEARDRVEAASEALLDRFLVGVERHEAWHLLAPSPKVVDNLSAHASAEAIAYLGALADSEGETPFVWDQLRAGFEALRASEPTTPTDVATMQLVPAVSREADAIHGVEDFYHRNRLAARRLLETWYGEKRGLRLIGHK